MVRADLPAILRASASTAGRSSAGGTTRLTRPSARAVPASINSPVNSISIAALRPTARASATIGVEQNRPILTPGVAKRASSAAMARSQVATSWQPAAVATPCTSAMTGFGSRTICSISSLQLEDAFISLASRVGAQFPEIVAGAKGRAGAGDDDDADLPVLPGGAESGAQFRHHRHRQRVARRRPVEGEAQHAAVLLSQHKGGILAGSRHRRHRCAPDLLRPDTLALPQGPRQGP